MTISLNPMTLLDGNGLDVQSVVNQLLSQQAGSLTLWRNQQTDLATQAGLLAGFNNNLTSLASAVNALADPQGALAAVAANSSDSSILTATAQNTAAAGTHQIIVNTLATVGTLYTNPLQDGNTSILAGDANTGTIQLQIGGAGGTTHDITITKGVNDTLSTLASYINAQNWGVTATAVTDADGTRLALVSQSSGTPGALAITANDTALVFNAPVGGTNASLTIDSVPFSSSSNTVTNAIPGITLNLASAQPSTTVQLTVGPDTGQATTAITNFVNAYNALINNLNSQFAVDPTTNSQGPLGSDSALRTLQSSLLRDVTYSISGNSGLVNLASLGIDMNNDGTLTVNQVATDTHPALSDVLAKNPSAVQSFFQNASSTGFANQLKTDLTSLTDPIDGILSVDIAGNKTQQTALGDQITALQTRLQAQQQALTLQFAQVNASLEAYPVLLQQTTAQLAMLTPSLFNASNAKSTTTTSGG